MKKMILLCGLALVASAGAGGAAATDLWLHVFVQENGNEAETVRVNVPLSLVRDLLPLIENEHIADGKLRILDDVKEEGVDVRAVWSALRSAADGEFVTVRGNDENVSIRKNGDFILVDVEEQSERGDGEKVKVSIPVAVVDALFSSPDENEIDVLAAVEALGQFSGHDVVVVEESDTSVRIWVDANPEGGR